VVGRSSQYRNLGSDGRKEFKERSQNPGFRRVWIGRATPLEVTLFQERSLNQHSLTKGRPSSIHDSVEADDRTTVID